VSLNEAPASIFHRLREEACWSALMVLRACTRSPERHARVPRRTILASGSGGGPEPPHRPRIARV
jgi:hypothetical protein